LPRLKEETKLTRELEKFAKLAASMGVDFKVDDNAVEAELDHRRKVPAYHEAEALLQALEKPATHTIKMCKRCGEPFGTNYRGVAYCSDTCRAKALAQIGIRWDWKKSPEERWGGEPPSVLSPQLVKLLQTFFSAHQQRCEEYEECEDPLSHRSTEDDRDKTNVLGHSYEQVNPEQKSEGSVFDF
jgi:hypothetical protein